MNFLMQLIKDFQLPKDEQLQEDHNQLPKAVTMLEECLSAITDDANRRHCAVAHALAIQAHAYAGNHLFAVRCAPLTDCVGMGRYSLGTRKLTEAIALWSQLSDGNASNASHVLAMDDKHRW